MDDCAVASKAGVEEFAVVVEGGVFSGDDFAKACFSCDVGGVDAVDVSFEVTGESAGADHGFVVEAVVSVSAVEDAAAGVVLVAVASCAVIEVAGVVASAVFEEWHEGIDIAISFVLAGKAEVGGHAVGVYVGACFVAEVEAADGCVRGESASFFSIGYLRRFKALYGCRVGAVSYEGKACRSCFSEELGVRVEEEFVVIRYVKDEVISVIFDAGMTGEVVRIDDGAVDFCTFSLDAFWSGEEGNGPACLNFFGIFCKGMDGGLADIGYVCHGKER